MTLNNEGTCLITGADPSLENSSGHKPAAYVKTANMRRLLEEYEQKVHGNKTPILCSQECQCGQNVATKDIHSSLKIRARMHVTMSPYAKTKASTHRLSACVHVCSISSISI